MDHNEFCCIFDASQYTGAPDTEPCPRAVDVPEAVRQLDALYNAGREDEAEDYLEGLLAKARDAGDWRAELSLLSELLGQYRRSMHEKKALRAVNDALALIRTHRMGRTLSGATVMLNAATTLKHFGRAEEALPIFRHVGRVYFDNLDPGDYRFGGLYNNMAGACVDLGDYAGAERCYRMALNVLGLGRGQDNDMAVTWCSLAELYDKQDPLDERVGQCMERAWAHLNAEDLAHDGYHALTIRKCLPCFDYFGYFLYVKELKERLEEIRERT